MADHDVELRLRMERAAAADDDVGAWGALLATHAARLIRVATFRLDRRLRGRIDPADVVQDVFATAAAHRADFLRLDSGVPLFVWLRGIVANKLLETHRRHLDVRMRAAGREVAGNARENALPDATSMALMDELTGGETGPGTRLANAEAAGRVRAALTAMSPADREALALRHFEQLTSAEAAQVLGIAERAAAKRYLRALDRLKEALADMPGGLTELRP